MKGCEHEVYECSERAERIVVVVASVVLPA